MNEQSSLMYQRLNLRHTKMFHLIDSCVLNVLISMFFFMVLNISFKFYFHLLISTLYKNNVNEPSQ